MLSPADLSGPRAAVPQSLARWREDAGKELENGRSARTAPCASSKRELTMRIAVMSDLHLEFDTGEARNDKDVGRRDRSSPFYTHPPQPKAQAPAAPTVGHGSRLCHICCFPPQRAEPVIRWNYGRRHPSCAVAPIRCLCISRRSLRSGFCFGPRATDPGLRAVPLDPRPRARFIRLYDRRDTGCVQSAGVFSGSAQSARRPVLCR